MDVRNPWALALSALLFSGPAFAGSIAGFSHTPCGDACSHTPGVGVGVLAAPPAIEEFPPAQRRVLERLVARAQAGDELPMMCLAPGTDPKFADAFNSYLESLRNEGPERYVLSGRWSTTALDGNTGAQGNPVTLTYSFVPDGTTTDEGPSDFIARFNFLYGSINVWQPLFQQALDEWTEVSGITYVWEQNDDGVQLNGAGGVAGVRGDVRIGGGFIDGNSGVLAYNYFPNNGDMTIDTGDNFYGAFGNNSIRLRNVVTHEAGHGIGLSHVESNNAAFLMEPFINTNFEGAQEDDQRGSGRAYGDRFENDDSFGAAGSLATMAGTAGAFGPGDSATVSNRSVDDSGDADYMWFNTAGSLDAMITLQPLGTTYNQGPQGGSQSSFNALTTSDLSFNVYDSSFGLVASVDATGAGSAESTTVSLVGTGPHYIRVNGDAGNIQRYDLDVAFSGGVACFGDCDGNGSFNVDDVDCFVVAFVGGDLSGADCDGNGTLNVDDVDCFVDAFVNQCQ
ncbi:MAG: hypothetical protein DHS20C14_04080 [Phycisphaeraceae bacterium]|nr:MAG: hypothetical protein DHS20C14_04080 [Phycisphaeraceae bacterium]